MYSILSKPRTHTHSPKALASLSLSSSSHGRSSESYTNMAATRSNFAAFKDDSTLTTSTTHYPALYKQSMDDLSQDQKNYYYASPNNPHTLITSQFNEQKNISATQLVSPSHQQYTYK